MPNDHMKELQLLRDCLSRTLQANRMTLTLLVVTEGYARKLYYQGNREADVNAINLMLNIMGEVIGNLQLQQRFLVQVENKAENFRTTEEGN